MVSPLKICQNDEHLEWIGGKSIFFETYSQYVSIKNGGSMHPQMIGHSTTRSRPQDLGQ